jgi:tetratricopeptide (TPR) repeat protein
MCLLAAALSASGCSNSAPSAYSKAEEAYKAGKYEEAIEHFNLAAKESDNPALYTNRANCHSYLGNLEAALADYDSALEAAKEEFQPNDPRLAYIYYNRGYACKRAGKYEQSIKDYEKTIVLDGKYPDVKQSLAWILATCPAEKLRDPKRAKQLAEAECQRSEWKDGSIIDTLAAAHAAAGDFQKAVELQQQAAALTNDPKLKAECEKRLELYRNGKPYIDAEVGKSIPE